MRYAALRCCASCEWIWRDPDPEKPGCPQCGFGSYGARWVHGDKAYRYATTQKPWLDKKIAKYERELLREIATHRGRTTKPEPLFPERLREARELRGLRVMGVERGGKYELCEGCNKHGVYLSCGYPYWGDGTRRCRYCGKIYHIKSPRGQTQEEEYEYREKLRRDEGTA